MISCSQSVVLISLQVLVFQEYRNESDVPIEAKYVFPLDGMAAGSKSFNE